MNVIFNSQFNCCPTIWMLHSRSLNNKINRLQERCLRMIYNDKQSNFEELLVRDNSVSIHHRNIQRLAIQMYMVTNAMSPNIMSEIFQLRESTHYHLRHTSQFMAHPIHGVYNGSESASYLGPEIPQLIPPPLSPPEIKVNESLAGFKETIEKWKPNDCPCRPCKVFISNVGFI